MSNKDKSDRKNKAQEIASNPSGFKVCEGCDSIVASTVIICPNCHAYRFDGTSTRVVDQAIYLGGREKTSVTQEDLH